jgi:hypothetical protein
VEQRAVNEFGAPIQFVELYVAFVYPRMPIISRELISKHFYDLPVGLLHAMYCCCFWGQASSSSFERHYEYSVQLLHEQLHEPDIFTLLLSIHLGYYLLYTKKTKHAISYLAISIRISQILGLNSANIAPIFEAAKNIEPAMVSEVCVGCIVHLYLYDFYFSNTMEIPFLLVSDFNSPLLSPYNEIAANLYISGK